MTFTEATRYVIAVGYAVTAIWLFIAARYAGRKDPAQLLYYIASVVAVAWSVWYFVLAIHMLPLNDAWGALNRALHLPIIALFGIAAWTRRKQSNMGG